MSEKKRPLLIRTHTLKLINVWTDGACKNNQGINGRERLAGWGVWWGHEHKNNCYGRVRGKQTNNRGELKAILQALVMFERAGFTSLVINTDSKYAIGLLSHGNNANANTDIVRDARETIRKLSNNGIKVTFKYVKGHSGDIGNDAADKLAVKGCLLSEGEECYPNRRGPIILTHPITPEFMDTLPGSIPSSFSLSSSSLNAIRTSSPHQSSPEFSSSSSASNSIDGRDVLIKRIDELTSTVSSLVQVVKAFDNKLNIVLKQIYPDRK
jgi:ribonuclease HI